MKNILVVNVNWVGDVVFSSPVFRALRQAYPQARIACLAVPRVKDVLSCIKEIDEIIVYDEKGKDYGLFAKCALVSRLRQQRFDAAFLLHRSLTRALLVWLAGIPRRIGYDTKRRGVLLTHRVKFLGERIHRSDHYLQVIEDFGVTVADRTTRLTVAGPVRNHLVDMLRAQGVFPDDRVVVINPGGNWDLKRWPKENFHHLIGQIEMEFAAKVVISGSPGDVELAREISNGTNAVVCAGKTNLVEMMALLERADVVVSNDSGPVHIANSLGTTVITLFGPTRPEITGPRGRGIQQVLQQDVGCNRRPCYYLDCPDNICMKAVSVERVVAALREVMTASIKENIHA